MKNQRNKSYLLRNLSPLQRGGLRSSILTIISSTIGAGLLSLPKTLATYGLGSGVFFLALFGLLTGYTYKILNDMIEESRKKSYANIVVHFFGKVRLDYSESRRCFC